jgi:hypothetical protein
MLLFAVSVFIQSRKLHALSYHDTRFHSVYGFTCRSNANVKGCCSYIPQRWSFQYRHCCIHIIHPLKYKTYLKLIRFYYILYELVETYHYPTLSLETLTLNENESTSIEDPAVYFAHYLRELALHYLAECDNVMPLHDGVDWQKTNWGVDITTSNYGVHQHL